MTRAARRPEGGRSRRAITGTVLSAVGVLLLSVASWRRFLADDLGATELVAVVAVLLAVVLGVLVAARLSRSGVRRVAQHRPGWHVHQVRSDAGLSDALLAHGRWEPGLRASGGSPLTLTWSTAGVELWRGSRRPRAVVSLPWRAVASVGIGTGRAASAPRPALVVESVPGGRLVLVPSRDARGSLLPATADQVAVLVADLRAARDAGEHDDRPAS
jgi:hypothetical protein